MANTKRPIKASSIKTREQFEEVMREGIPVIFEEGYPLAPSGHETDEDAKTRESEEGAHMVTFAEAKRLALECWDEIDYVTEYPDAYSFSKLDDYRIGGNGPVVVLKATGECINFVAYLTESKDSTPLRMGPLTDFA
jgi:hypothetical protein